MNMRCISEFEGLVAVVTGGSSGIGRAIASVLIDRGATVFVVGRRAALVERAADEIGARPAVADVSDSAALIALADGVEREFGRLDLLVNNAGVGPLASFDDLSLEDFRWVMDINFTGVLNGIKAFLPLLRSNPKGARIVNTASLAAFAPAPGTTAYAASKAAVVALSEALAGEFERESSLIGVSVLAPAPVRTAIAESARARPGFSGRSPDPADFLPPVPEIDAEDVGRLVVDSLATTERYIVTHPDTWPAIERRFAALGAAHGA